MLPFPRSGIARGALIAALAAVAVTGVACNVARPELGDVARGQTMLAAMRPEAPEPERARGSSAAADEPTSPRVEALDGAPLVDLAVPGFAPAVVSIPLGATRRKPVLVATHGSADIPEAQCRSWRAVVGDRGFVVCPRGSARPDAPTVFEYDSAVALRREVKASLAALATRYPDHVDPSAAIYAGFSLGAVLGVHVLAELPGQFQRAVLIEGGNDRWTRTHVSAFASGGGDRVLLACGDTLCPSEARGAARGLLAAGIDARVVVAESEGHRYGKRMMATIETAFPWLVRDDPRWSEPEGQITASR